MCVFVNGGGQTAGREEATSAPFDVCLRRRAGTYMLCGSPTNPTLLLSPTPPHPTTPPPPSPLPPLFSSGVCVSLLWRSPALKPSAPERAQKAQGLIGGDVRNMAHKRGEDTVSERVRRSTKLKTLNEKKKNIQKNLEALL